MRILVCVKQVPDRESAFRINDSGTGFDETAITFLMNPYDEFAVEEALRIKERVYQAEITAISVGPKRVESTVRRALELGVDHGVLVTVPDGYYLTAVETSTFIAGYAAKNGFDLIFLGVMSEDYQRAQTGPMVAAQLALPCATGIVSEVISDDGSRVTIERELESGRREARELFLPAVLTVQSGINIPRYPRLSDKLRAKKQALEIVSLSEQPSWRPRKEKPRVSLPRPLSKGVFIEGSLEEKATRLVQIIHEKTQVV
jgi:electron transfer flavoprotein beta subunit